MELLIMNNLQSYINVENKEVLLIGAVAVQAFLALPFVICTFVVASTANAGFNVVLTGFLNCAFIGGSYYLIKFSKSPIAVGFLIGSAAMTSALNFMTSVYWGQLSHCKVEHEDVSGYSCSNHSAYGAVSAFAVLLFLVQLSFTAAVWMWRGSLISQTELYDELSASARAAESAPYPYNPSTTATASADL